MPPSYMKPYVKRQKNDAADAEAICEGHASQHAICANKDARAAELPLTEFSIVAPVGRKGATDLLHVVADPSDKRVPAVGRACLAALGDQLLGLKRQILELDRMIMAWHRSNQTSKRLHYIPGVGPMLATALVASVADPRTDQDATSRPGLGSFRSSIQVGARSGSAASANRGTAICAACSWPEHSRLSATPRSMAPDIGPGSRRC